MPIFSYRHSLCYDTLHYLPTELEPNVAEARQRQGQDMGASAALGAGFGENVGGRRLITWG